MRDKQKTCQLIPIEAVQELRIKSDIVGRSDKKNGKVLIGEK